MQVKMYIEEDRLVLVREPAGPTNVKNVQMDDLQDATKEEPITVTFDAPDQAGISATPMDQRPLGQRSQIEQDRHFQRETEARDKRVAEEQAADRASVEEMAEAGLENPTRQESDGVTEQRTRPMREEVEETREELEQEQAEEERDTSATGNKSAKDGGAQPSAGRTATAKQADTRGSTQTGSRFGNKNRR
jgi:hypothetical protein